MPVKNNRKPNRDFDDSHIWLRVVYYLQRFFLILVLLQLSYCALMTSLKGRMFLKASSPEFLRYEVAAVLPCAIMLLLVLGLLFFEKKTLTFLGKFDLFGCRFKGLFWALGLIVWIAGIGFLPNAKLALLHFANGSALLVLLWSVHLKDARPILVSWFPLALLTIPMLLDMYPPTSWWGRSTHLYDFRATEPVIGPGGRLVPDLDIHMYGVDTPKPRRLITNSWGFRNSEDFPMEKPFDEIRILNLGDSFSIGYQLDQYHFLGPLLASNLALYSPDANVRVLNAAISDPAYGLYYLQHQGIHFEPDIVILGVCGNDFVQAYGFAGPGQRFARDDEGVLTLDPNYDATQFNNPVSLFKEYTYASLPGAILDSKETSLQLSQAILNPWRGYLQLRPIRSLLHLFRSEKVSAIRNYERVSQAEAISKSKTLIDGLPNIGFFSVNEVKPVTEMYQTTFSLFAGMKRACQKTNIPFVIIYFPLPFQVLPGEWQRLCSAWGLRSSDFDLLKHNRKIDRFCRAEDIYFLDATEIFANYPNPDLLFLPGDAHPTELAHELLAKRMTEVVRLLIKQRESPL